MSDNMFGRPHQSYYIDGIRYQANAAGKIIGVTDLSHRSVLIDAGCVGEDVVVAASSDGGVGAVLTVAGRTGNVTLSASDIISGLGTAASHAATDFDVSGAAATAQSNAEAYADAGDAPAVDVTITTHDATADVVAATYTPSHNTLIHVEGTFLARAQSGTDGKTRKVTAAFLTDNSGAVTIAGTALGGDNHNTAGATAWTSSLQTDGAVVQFVVTGAAATDIDWRVIGDITAGP